MNITKLNFTQKVWLGFVIIIVLLSISSSVSLYHLWAINSSTNEVKDQAVPIFEQSNRVQISLLKQAKLSSTGFNAVSKAQIISNSEDYNKGAESFKQLFDTLKSVVESDSEMLDLAFQANEFYNAYHNSVKEMFEAKLKLLDARNDAEEELRLISNLVDDAGALLLEVSYFETESEKDAKTIEIIAGIAGRIDGQLIGIYNQAKESNSAQDLSVLETTNEDIIYAFSDMQQRIDYAATSIAEVDTGGLWKEFVTKVAELKERTTKPENIIHFKKIQLEQANLSRKSLEQADSAVRKVVASFDILLHSADQKFKNKQSEVLNAVSLGSQTSLFAWIILIVLAWHNFNSMRKSIKKKVADLAALNSTGEVLASILDQNKALEAVLESLHQQTGVAQGSVYLMNDNGKLEIKAHHPPRNIPNDAKPKVFDIGEGILGKAVEKKKIIFVSDTNKNRSFIKDNKKDQSKALLCVPLLDKEMLIGAINFSGDVESVNFEDSDYEFASSIARLLVITIKNIRMREVIEEQNRTLEQKVKERTFELQQKNKDIAIMMANMKQGLFMIMDGGTIHSEYSTVMTELFETKHIASRNFMDLVFANSNLGSNSRDQIKNAIDALFGMDEMMFDCNSHLLVGELTKTMESGNKKVIELDWAPIVNNDDEIDKIMVSARDVTELRVLQHEAEAQKKELEIIGHILSVEPSKFHEFLTSSFNFIEKCKVIIENSNDKNTENIATLFRNMHTIKGNARTFGFDFITNSVHEVEQSYDDLRKNNDMPWEKEKLLAELQLAEQDIQRYRDISTTKLGMQPDSAIDAIEFDTARISKLIADVSKLDIQKNPSHVSSWVRDAYFTLIEPHAKTISNVIEDVISSVHSLACELGKSTPKIIINDNDVFIKVNVHSMLSNIFMHVLRNAVDHGIESDEERMEANKSIPGNISIITKIINNQVLFVVRDDGKGLAIDRIYDSAISKSILDGTKKKPNAQEIAALVFSSGFSTAESVTEISGRGVGMDAVRQFLEELGGGIEILLDDPNDKHPYCSFETHIILGMNHWTVAPSIAKSA